MIGAMSKRGQDTTSSDGSPMAKARPANLVSQGQCKEDVPSQGSGSPANPGSVNNRKRVSPATGNRCSSSSNSEIGSCQVYRREMVNPAARKLGQEDLTRPKSEEDFPCTGQPAAVSPEMESMKFFNCPYVEKIFHCIQKKLGRTSTNATFSVVSYKNNVLAWRMYMASSMKAAIHLGQDFLENSEIYENTKFEHQECVRHHSKIHERAF